jgi:diphthine-ammonia ligase
MNARSTPAPSLPSPGVPFAVSWSGGKDSCLALHCAMRGGARPARLLTMMDEGGQRSRSHGLRRDVLEAQARLLGIPLVTGNAGWPDYEAEFSALLRRCRGDGIEDVVFGDIDLEDHRLWEERVCAAAGVRAHLPLWQSARSDLLDEWWQFGFAATIVVVRADVLGPEFLGHELTRALAAEFTARGLDACGENGEFHTLATSGPLFERPLSVRGGDVVTIGGCHALDVRITPV